MIEVEQLSYTIEKRAIIDNLSLLFETNTFYGLIGPNGTGKSTLIQLISGLLKACSGRVTIDGKLVSAYTNKELARKVAMLQQGGIEPLSYTVQDVLLMARYPYQRFLRNDAAIDQKIVEEAVRKTNLEALVHKRLNELSGGERQRVALAKLWVQRPQILLLDEPTTFLDIGYQQMVMEFIANWQKEEQLLVIAVMHDINLAALYCDKIVALQGGKCIASGETNDVLSEPLMAQLFAAQIQFIDHPTLNVPQMIMNHIKS